MANQKKEIRSSLPMGILAGWAVAIVMTAVISAITASVISGERAGEEILGTAAVAAVICSAVIGSFVSKGLASEKKMVACIGCAIAYLATLLGVHAIFFEGEYHGVAAATLVILGSGLAVAMIGMGYKPKTKAHHKRTKRA